MRLLCTKLPLEKVWQLVYSLLYRRSILVMRAIQVGCGGDGVAVKHLAATHLAMPRLGDLYIGFRGSQPVSYSVTITDTGARWAFRCSYEGRLFGRMLTAFDIMPECYFYSARRSRCNCARLVPTAHAGPRLRGLFRQANSYVTRVMIPHKADQAASGFYSRLSAS